MIDAHGNQVQITYKELIPKAYYVQDDVISTIAYAAPACHTTTTACTGSAWNPQVTLTFDSSDAVPTAES